MTRDAVQHDHAEQVKRDYFFERITRSEAEHRLSRLNFQDHEAKQLLDEVDA